MRYFNVLLIMALLPFYTFSQESRNSYLSGAISGEYSQTNHSGYGSVGLDAWIPIKKKFTLNYGIRMGIPGNGIYVRGSAGLMLGGALIGASGEEGGLLVAIGAITMLLPEGVGVYVGNDKRKIHIGINPLAAEYRFIPQPKSEWSQLSGNICVRGEFPMEWGNVNFISPYFATFYNYDAVNPFGVRAGISVGFKNN